MVRHMGSYATAKRSDIKAAFEASSGDRQGDMEPVFIETRTKPRKEVATAEVRFEKDTMDVRFRIAGAGLDDADVARIFHIAYLDVLTGHWWREHNAGKVSQLKIRMTNVVTGVSTTGAYPDPE